MPTTHYSSLITHHLRQRRTGFTLIELLVIIAIIGILATISVASFSGAQARGRDSRRKTDLDAVKKALELARQDTAGAYYYPSCDTYVSGSCGITGTSTNPDLSPASNPYIKAVPKDPKTGSAYTYTPIPASCGASACTGYSIVACLENQNDSQKDTTQNTTVCPLSTNTVSYTVSPN